MRTLFDIKSAVSFLQLDKTISISEGPRVPLEGHFLAIHMLFHFIFFEMTSCAQEAANKLFFIQNKALFT